MTGARKYTKEMLPSLKQFEHSSHYFVFISSLLYALYRFHLATHSQRFFNQTYLTDYDFQCYIPWLCQWPKDVTDQEWQVVKNLYLTKQLAIFAFHSIGFQIIRQVCPKLLSTYIIIYSSISVTVLHSFDGLAILYANILFVITCEYLFTFFEFRLRKWFHYLFFLVAVMISFRLNLLRNGEKNLLYQVLFCWFNARCFSSSVDLLTDGGLFDSSILVRLSYLFYLPPSFFGPFYHYSDYAPQLKRLEASSSSIKINQIITKTIKIIRILFWAFVLEEVLHRFLFSSSYQYYIYLLQRFDSWSLAGFGFSLTILFYVKYLIIYGMPQALSELDGFDGNMIKNPPECIAHIHKTSYLWRTFDRGLYSFLVKYFYKPITGKDHNNPYRKIFAGIVCFVVVMIWHECHHSVVVWISLNIVLSCCEIASTSLKQKSWYRHFVKEYLSTNMEQRINHVFGSPYLIFAYLSNVYFLSNYESGMLLLTRLVFSWSIVPLMLIFYCGCFVSSNLNERLRKC